MYFNFPWLYIGNNRNNLPEKFNDKAKKKNYLRGIFFYIRGKTSLVTLVFAQKRGERPRVQGALLFRMTKIIHFPAKSKCVNTSSTVKMQQFAAEGVWKVLYYEVHMGGLASFDAIGLSLLVDYSCLSSQCPQNFAEKASFVCGNRKCDCPCLSHGVLMGCFSNRMRFLIEGIPFQQKQKSRRVKDIQPTASFY